MQFARMAVHCPWRWEVPLDKTSMCSIPRIDPKDGSTQGCLRCLPKNCAPWLFAVLQSTGIPMPTKRASLSQRADNEYDFTEE